MNAISEFISFSNNILWSYILIFLLISLGLFFTLKTRFVQFRYLKEMFKLLGSSISSETEGISSFQAFCISTASRVGTGNLAGVALAISLGGPGSIFWMWLIALIGGASSFIESTLAQVFKVKDKDGYRGGPAYYMKIGLNKPWMGIIFSILITICFGLVFNSVQSNTVSLAFQEAFGVNTKLTGIFLTIITAAVIFGGVKRIAKVSEFIVPIMALAYIFVSLFVVVKNISLVPNIFSLIIKNAFGIKEIAGGTVGAALRMGIKRGLFSNEAGMGSAPNAAATAEVEHPVHQGLIQTLGVFTDTILICSCTAFIILISGAYTDKSLTGIQLTQIALSSEVGSWAKTFIAVCIFMFAYSSILGNYYYGESNIEFISENKLMLTIYRIFVIGMVLLGSLVQIQIVWDMADLFMGLMAILNLIAIILLSKIAFDVLKDYEIQKSNKTPLNFNPKKINSLKGINLPYWSNKKQE
ncbi:alanine/glycine:cation symporter family protein [Hathewaya histolytica]|uniref:Sodium:alanine symporter family protein n=1 Tax=Hathewaya histolytica TaxID=1498 RepID=A0A4U9R0I4_HATHI|nr:alanine/glycine:cation symporter family protein [Hathewaya histolytica]VTQ84652.1 sodium:alanine symporter family protein [Hathewaya histolytica]